MILEGTQIKRRWRVNRYVNGKLQFDDYGRYRWYWFACIVAFFAPQWEQEDADAEIVEILQKWTRD